MKKNAYTDLLSFLETQEIVFMERLYRKSIFSMFLLKILSDYTVSFLFDLLHCATNITTLKNTKELVSAIKTLRSLHLLDKRGQNLYLRQGFRDSLLKGFALLTAQNFFVPCAEKYAEQESKRFEKILQNIVEPRNHEMAVKSILVHGELVDSNFNITHKGFEFLLKTHKDQMWLLLIYGFQLIAADDAEREVYLLGLAELSHKKPSTCYQAAFPKKMMLFFSQLGLVEIVRDGVIFLKSDFRTLFENEVAELNKFLLVETNHKIYAYTTSQYELSIMSLFCRIDLVMSFLVVGAISEENINRAFSKGITAEQIVNYLRSYCKALPQAICDLIFIWESQRIRMSITDSYLYSNFLNFSDFKKVLVFSKENSFLIDHDEQKRMIVVKADAHPFMKEFVRKNI